VQERFSLFLLACFRCLRQRTPVYAGLQVYLFLAGMMILAALAREEGVFDWVADVAARHAGHSPGRLFLLIYLAGTVITALLSNDATAVVLTPAVLAVVRRAKVEANPICWRAHSWRMRQVSFSLFRIQPTWSSSMANAFAGNVAAHFSASFLGFHFAHVPLLAVADTPGPS